MSMCATVDYSIEKLSLVKNCHCVENVPGSTQHIFMDDQNQCFPKESFPAVSEPTILQVTLSQLDAIAQKILKAIVNVFITNITHKY